MLDYGNDRIGVDGSRLEYVYVVRKTVGPLSLHEMQWHA